MTDFVDRLKRIQDKLMLTAELDCDPENWTGYGKKPKDMDKATRGNAIYDRKLAAGTIGLALRIDNYLTTIEKPTQGNTKSDEDLNGLIENTDKEAEKLLKMLEENKQAKNVH